MACCSRLSKVYVVLTNLLFACLGFAYVVFGVFGFQNKFPGAPLFPDIVFKLSAILGAIIIIATLFGFSAAFSKRRGLVYIYLLIILVSLAIQVVIGVKVYQIANNGSQYANTYWADASIKNRSLLQQSFSCCGYSNSNDNPAPTDQCTNTSNTMILPCADIIKAYTNNAFQKVYLITFAALAVQLLAVSNAITIICSSQIYGDEHEYERRQQRKSGIRLDDMTVDTPTTAGSYNNFAYQQDQKTYYEDGPQYHGYNNHNNDMYNHHNNSGYSYQHNNNGYNQHRY
ncbi:unnamed protein product [Cunninghamella blakesleeana]